MHSNDIKHYIKPNTSQVVGHVVGTYIKQKNILSPKFWKDNLISLVISTLDWTNIFKN